MQDTLPAYWNSILSNYSDKSYSEQLFQKLVEKYSEKNRFYHNLTHIQKMLDLSAEYSTKINDIETLRLAIFYHDIIYNSLSKNNETDSAALAVQELSHTTLSHDKIRKTELFILSTQKHFPLTDDPDLHFFLDFDLAILGAAQEVYIDYAQKIRKEYKWVPAFLYKKNRIKVLAHFLQRDSIYFTAAFRNGFENIARQNLQYEIDVLLK